MLAILLLSACVFSSCSIKKLRPSDYTELNCAPGITLSLSNISPAGLTYEIANSSGKPCFFGEQYEVERYIYEKWYKIELPPGVDYGWSYVLFVIENGLSRGYNIDWQYYYGELPAGKYRLVKQMMHDDYYKPDNIYYLAAEFEITE